jgi:hypothetical protein
MINLSFSTINNCLQPNNSHCWLNRQMGRKIPENDAMRKGRELQDYIKEHQSDFLELNEFYIGNSNFDKSMKIETIYDGFINLDKGKFEVIGFIDGKKDEQLLEIKTGTKMWSIMDFYNSMQIRLYASITNIDKFLCMTALSDKEQWTINPPKFYEIKITDEMKISAIKWVNEAIKIYELGQFKGGLDENDKCNIWCPYGENCFFKS